MALFNPCQYCIQPKECCGGFPYNRESVCPNCDREDQSLYISDTGVTHCGCYYGESGAIYNADVEEKKRK